MSNATDSLASKMIEQIKQYPGKSFEFDTIEKESQSESTVISLEFDESEEAYEVILLDKDTNSDYPNIIIEVLYYDKSGDLSEEFNKYDVSMREAIEFVCE